MGLLGPPGYLTIRTSRCRKGYDRRRARFMSKRDVVWVKWGCWELGLRYHRRRGWRPVSLIRLFGPGKAPLLPGLPRSKCEEEVCWTAAR